MPSLEELEHKLRLVEASRRRLQSAPWSTYSRSDTSKQMMSQLAAQLRETEDELSRQRAKNDLMQRSNAAEIADLRSKFAHLEDQQADIDALMTQNPSVASEIKKAYLTGKVEVQRTMRRVEKEIESLRSALHHAEEKSESAHGQMMELKTKYYETVRQKSSLYRHTQTLQQQVQDLQLQQAECVSSTIRNTQRAQQMSQRVMQSLASVERRPPALGSGDGEVSTLRVENAILHEVLQCSLPHLDPAGHCLVSTVTGTMRLSPQTSMGKPSAAAVSAHFRGAQQGPNQRVQDRSAQSQVDQEAATTSGMVSTWLAPPGQDSESAGEGLHMVTTLRKVLGESREPEDAGGSDGKPFTGPTGGADSSSESEWSGDDVIQVASQTLRGSMPASQAWPATANSDAAGPPRRASQVHFSSSTRLPSDEGTVPRPAAGMEGGKRDSQDHDEPLRLSRSVRRHKKGPKARRDTMELSRVPRLAARLRAPMNANSAVSFLQKLAKARTDGGLQGEPATGFCMPADDTPAQELLNSSEPNVQPSVAVGNGTDGDDAQMEKARAIMLAAVQRRKLGKLGIGKQAVKQPEAENNHAAGASGTEQPPPVDSGLRDQAGVPEAMAKTEGLQTPGSDMPSEQPGTPPDEPGGEEKDVSHAIATTSRSISMRMPDVHATSIAVANALRSIGSARGRDQVRGKPTAAWNSSFRSRSLSHSPARSVRVNTGMTSPLVSGRPRHSPSPSPRRCSLSPQRLATGKQQDTVIAELQAQSNKMASIMTEHMPWMINEVTRATRAKVAASKAPCECQPPLSIPVLAQTAQKSSGAVAPAQHAVQHGHTGKLAGSGGILSGPQPAKDRSVAKAAGDKYAAALMQPGMWRPPMVANVRLGGAVTLHPPASHGLRYQQSLHRNTSV